MLRFVIYTKSPKILLGWLVILVDSVRRTRNKHVVGRGGKPIQKLIIKSEQEIPVQRRTRGKEHDIGMNRKGKGYEAVDWVQLAQDRVHWWVIINVVMNFVLYE
jgi:hypothetical protein